MSRTNPISKIYAGGKIFSKRLRCLARLWIFFVYGTFIMLQKKSFGRKKIWILCRGSEVPFWQGWKNCQNGTFEPVHEIQIWLFIFPSCILSSNHLKNNIRWEIFLKKIVIGELSRLPTWLLHDNMYTTVDVKGLRCLLYDRIWWQHTNKCPYNYDV